MIRSILVALGDCLLAALAAAIVLIVLTGGGVFYVADVRLSARSVGHPLFVLAVLCAIRWWMAPSLPFFWTKQFTPMRLESISLRRVEAAVAWLASMNGRTAATVVLVLASLVLAVKASSIYAHPGFVTGDDVEVQEMALGRLLRVSWPVWDIRSPVYPMIFLYPAQAVAYASGITEITVLVSVGRAWAAIVSTGLLPVLFIASRRCAGVPAALVVVTVAATSHLLVTFGATELPRPLAAVLVVAAFACLRHGTWVGAVGGGALVGLAATLRFSEAVFLLPAILQVTLERRWAHLVAFSGAFVSIAACTQLTGDLLFWGSPFHSLIRIVQYTVVERQSSRGFQPFWEYLWNITSWTDPVVAGLAVLGTAKATWRPAVWAWLPLLVLSLFPHKEARYLVPVIPFVAMLAGMKLWDLAQIVVRRASVSRVGARRLALILCAAIIASATYQISRFNMRRSDDAVRLAHVLADEGADGGLAVEQLWRMGGRLYLSEFEPLRDLDPATLRTRGGIRDVGEDQRLRWILLRLQTCREECVSLLLTRGFRERQPPVPSDYRLFERVTPAAD